MFTYKTETSDFWLWDTDRKYFVRFSAITHFKIQGVRHVSDKKSYCTFDVVANTASGNFTVAEFNTEKDAIQAIENLIQAQDVE